MLGVMASPVGREGAAQSGPASRHAASGQWSWQRRGGEGSPIGFLTTPGRRVEVPLMPSARIYHFPRAARRRSAPPRPPAPLRSTPHHYAQRRSLGFSLLLVATLVSAFFYLSGAASLTRHDARYIVLLVAVWVFYFLHDFLLATRLGPLLVLAGRLLLIASVVGFFGGIYWLILTHD